MPYDSELVRLKRLVGDEKTMLLLLTQVMVEKTLITAQEKQDILTLKIPVAEDPPIEVLSLMQNTSSSTGAPIQPVQHNEEPKWALVEKIKNIFHI